MSDAFVFECSSDLLIPNLNYCLRAKGLRYDKKNYLCSITISIEMISEITTRQAILT